MITISAIIVAISILVLAIALLSATLSLLWAIAPVLIVAWIIKKMFFNKKKGGDE